MEQTKRLISIMETLRGENGCPWDKKQDHKTLIPYVIEEAYEVVETLEAGDMEGLKEELGDLLFQVVFHAQLANERKEFDFEEIAKVVSEKLVRRHPHVFGNKEDISAEQVVTNWEKIKQTEKTKKVGSILDSASNSLPPLSRAEKMQKEASKVGFDWPDAKGATEKFKEEVNEFLDEMNSGTVDKDRLEDELGDVFFSLVNVARLNKISAEKAMNKACLKFKTRFQFIENSAKDSGKKLEEMTLEEMDALWEIAKKKKSD
jgi:tetrapyrrole methylase family protein/MazG family protein